MKFEDVQTENYTLKKENESLKRDLSLAERKLAILQSTEKQKEQTFVASQIRIDAESKLRTWEKIIDEMAHSVNTDVFVAVSYLSRESYKNDPNLQKALHHTKQVRDFINLFMWYLQRDKMKPSGKTAEISIENIVRSQLELIKAGISTLRLSTDEHEEALKNLQIPVDISGESTVVVSEELKEVIPLIIKDLIRNAMKHSNDENPKVSIQIISDDKFVVLTIINNTVISTEYANWINGKSDTEPGKISKSMKVGLRVIKMWTKLLKTPVFVNPDTDTNSTTTVFKIPRELYYEPGN